jgi:hypothetical protein
MALDRNRHPNERWLLIESSVLNLLLFFHIRLIFTYESGVLKYGILSTGNHAQYIRHVCAEPNVAALSLRMQCGYVYRCLLCE